MQLANFQRNCNFKPHDFCIAFKNIVKQKLKDFYLKHPVILYFKALTKSEQNYVGYELKLYAFVCIWKLKDDIIWRQVYGAYRSLNAAQCSASLLFLTTCVRRLILRLLKHTVKIKYQTGQENVIVDKLSRLFAESRDSKIFSSFDKIFLENSFVD